MVVEKEGTFEVEGKSLYTKSWLPDADTPTKAKVVFIHGYSDHINRYNPFFRYLASHGIAVHGFDQRGWGRSVASPADRGLTGPTPRVIADIAAFLTSHLPASPADHPPVFVLGHSMGGQEALTLACDPAHESVVRRVRGWLLESPFIGYPPETQPSALKVFGARLVGRLLPTRQMLVQLPPKNLTRDPAVVKSIAEDTLMHDYGTLEGLAGMIDRTAGLSSGRVRPKGGVVRGLWLGHGTRDMATSFTASKRYVEECCGEVQDKAFKAYEGWYHQLHNDGECSEEFFGDVKAWILERCGSEEGKQAAKL